MQALVREVDAKLIERIGTTRHVLWAGKIKETDEGVKVIATEALIDVFVEPGKKKRIKGLGKFVTVVGGAIGVEEDSTELLLDELCLVSKSALECGRLYTKELGNDAENIHVANDSCVQVTTTVDGELEITQVENGCDELAGLGNMALGEANGLECQLELFKAIGIVVTDTIGASACTSALAEVTVLGLVDKVEMLALFLRCTCHQVIENVEIPFTGWHSRHSVAFEIVVKRLDTTQPPLVGELKLCVFSEARRIWIEEGASVAKGLYDELCCGHLACKLGALLSRIGNGQLK